MTGKEENQLMLKKWIYYSGVLAGVVFISFGFVELSDNKQQLSLTTENKKTFFLFPSSEIKDYEFFRSPLSGKTFTGFKEALAFKESQGRYKLINTLGYMGKFQFGKTTLKAIGITNYFTFLNNPQLQEEAFVKLLTINKAKLQSEIEMYEGKIFNDVTITESGILAAAHLGGAETVRKYLKSNGKRQIKDQYGTSVVHYMKKFGGYDTSSIVIEDQRKVCVN
ncbi:MAG: peptidoglycan-binding protein LysM [Flavobacterium sp.]